ncbi:MAG: omptin family outer membrane protease [Leptospirales bacterium]
MKIRLIQITLLIILVGLIYPISFPILGVDYSGNSVNVEAGVGLLNGHTTYQIGGNFNSNSGSGHFRFPLSELRFPLENIFYVYNSIEYTSKNKWRFLVSVKIDASNYAGKLRDSDWGIFYYNGISGTSENSLDIFSKTDTYVDFILWQFQFRWDKKINSKSYFSPGFGFEYRSFNFTGKDVRQTYPSCGSYGICSSYPDININGRVITYDIQFYVPMVMIGYSYRFFKKWNLNIDTGVSPYLYVTDLDNHLLRYKKSKGKASGQSYMASLYITYNFNRRAGLNLGASYSGYSARGRQKQVYYKTSSEANRGDWAKIDYRVFSSTYEFVLSFNYLFT